MRPPLRSVLAACALLALPSAALAEPFGSGPSRAERPPEPRPEPRGDLAWGFLALQGRVDGQSVRGADRNGRTAGAQIGTTIDWLQPSGLSNSRTRLDLSLGGGGGGLEGTALLSSAHGVRVPVARDQGPILRAAFVLRYEGNGRLLSSQVQLPQGQLGYQLLDKYAMVEAAGTASLVLTGRFDPGDRATRSLGVAPSWGGQLAVALRPLPGGPRDFAPYSGLRLDAEFLRIEARSGTKTPVDQLRTRLCASALVALCADVAWMRGGVLLPGGVERSATVFYGGVSLGLGLLFADRIS